MIDIRKKLAVAVGAGVAGAAVSTLLFLGAGTAQALPTNEEVGFGFVEKGIIIINSKPTRDGVGTAQALPNNEEVGIIVDGGGKPSGDENGFIIVGGTPSGEGKGFIIVGGKPSGEEVGISDPEDKVGIGNPDTHPPVRIGGGNPGSAADIGGFNPQPDPPGNPAAESESAR